MRGLKLYRIGSDRNVEAEVFYYFQEHTCRSNFRAFAQFPKLVFQCYPLTVSCFLFQCYPLTVSCLLFKDYQLIYCDLDGCGASNRLRFYDFIYKHCNCLHGWQENVYAAVWFHGNVMFCLS